MKKILILGGTGAIGSPLVSRLVEQHNMVYVTSRSYHENQEHLIWLKGDAHDIPFLKECLSTKYDAIVDFMIYKTEEFNDRIDMLLDATNQYFLTSSCRVFADRDEFIKESSTRLLDSCKKKNYLKTDEYALAKARQENILANKEKKNWTVIRPYITYNDYRLQLGEYEKETWLYRVINGKKVVVSRDLLDTVTTLTCGRDVADYIVSLIGNPDALGQSFNLVSDDFVKWKDVLDIYQSTYKKVTGKDMQVVEVDSILSLGCLTWRTLYDRLVNRKFDNHKLCSVEGNFEFIPVRTGLEECFTRCLQDTEHLNLKPKNWIFEACMDRATKDKTPLSIIKGKNNKLKYMIYRYLPMSFYANIKLHLKYKDYSK